jgi:hypothetical protein
LRGRAVRPSRDAPWIDHDNPSPITLTSRLFAPSLRGAGATKQSILHVGSWIASLAHAMTDSKRGLLRNRLEQ